MNGILSENRFDFVSDGDKAFVQAFDDAMNQRGYDYGEQIGPGFCWGKYMLIYSRTGAKSKNVVARIYLAENGIVLRLFLNGIDKHRVFIENAPAHIHEVFVGGFGDCQHCKNDHNGICKFRKSYTLDGRLIDKCTGFTFQFLHPEMKFLDDYLALFNEFYPLKNKAA